MLYWLEPRIRFKDSCYSKQGGAAAKVDEDDLEDQVWTPQLEIEAAMSSGVKKSMRCANHQKNPAFFTIVWERTSRLFF